MLDILLVGIGGFIVGILLCGNIAVAQERAVFDSYTEAHLKDIYLMIVNGEGKEPTDEQRDVIMKVLVEFQSISQHLFDLNENTIESQRNMAALWDDKIALQKSNLDQHTYYRALYGYYLTYFSTAPGKGEGDEPMLTWEQVDYKNKFGHSIYEYIKCAEAFDKAASENPESRLKIILMKNMFAYATGAAIPEEKLKIAWENGLKQKLTGEDNAVLQFLYSNELMRLWTSLYKQYQKKPDNRFDLYWDKTFWLQKTKKEFNDHRFYRQVVCTFISDYAGQIHIRDETPEMVFALGFSDFMGCNVLNVLNYHEFKWYKKLTNKQRRMLQKKNEKGSEPKDEPLEYYDQRNLG